MREGKLATLFVFALTLLSAVAYAGSAPKELYGKSITVRWSETETVKIETEQTTRNFGNAVQMHIYISTAGRPFVRVTRVGIGGCSRKGSGCTPSIPTGVSEVAPGESKADHVTFEGRSLVVYRELQSGARRVVIDFDATSASCKAHVTHGREGGKNIVRNTRGVGKVEVLSIQAGGESCSIQEGNVFG